MSPSIRSDAAPAPASSAAPPSTTAAGASSTDLLPMGLLRDALAAVLHPSSPSPFQLVFSSHPGWPRPAPGASVKPSRSTSPSQPRELRISCLDSSFNPPTRAHQALASAPYPLAKADQWQGGEYDAHLLLLSVRNVDKVLSSGDADYEQRLQMIHLLAQDILAASQDSDSSPQSWRNVAIGLLSEPAFIDKDKVIRGWLRSQGGSAGHDRQTSETARDDIKLCWLVGTDTVERFFDQKYYTQPLETCLPPFFDPPATSNASPSELIHFARPAAAPSSAGATPPAPLYEATIASLALPTGAVRVGQTRGSEDWGHVSSTVVRKGVAAGGDEWRDLVGPSLAAYVEREGLYH